MSRELDPESAEMWDELGRRALYSEQRRQMVASEGEALYLRLLDMSREEAIQELGTLTMQNIIRTEILRRGIAPDPE
jgi:hypothetical protein